MNFEEISQLLTQCASYDARTIGKADALAWHAVLGDLPLADAQAAVVAYYTVSSQRIMPADVRAGVRRIRRDRTDHADTTFVYTGHPDDTREYQRQLRAHIRTIGDGQPEPELPELPQRFTPAQLAGVFKTPPPARTLLPAAPVSTSPRALALMRSRLDRAGASEPIEGELLPAEEGAS